MNVAEAKAEKDGYGLLERILFLITPVLFTALLLGILLLIFDTDLRSEALDIGRRIPVVGKLLPEPAAPTESPRTPEETVARNARDTIRQLEALLAEREEALRQSVETARRQEAEIAELRTQVEELSQSLADKAITTTEYEERIRSLADMYGRMTPTRAAPILENMTAEEAALILDYMPENTRARILERMNPGRAAEVTNMLKDSVPVDDRQIAALQSRVRELEERLAEPRPLLEGGNLGSTFISMNAEHAATLILEMARTDRNKALYTLASMDGATRSQVVGAMTEKDRQTTAALMADLVPPGP
jgi:flagellar motility protein MotE (MotC chaperone)